jgi:hypothetical protein
VNVATGNENPADPAIFLALRQTIAAILSGLVPRARIGVGLRPSIKVDPMTTG